MKIIPERLRLPLLAEPLRLLLLLFADPLRLLLRLRLERDTVTTIISEIICFISFYSVTNDARINTRSDFILFNESIFGKS